MSAVPAFALPAALLSQGYALRPETDDDVPFLLQLYASTRADELASIPWSAEQKQAFLASQFQAQRDHYRTHFTDCAFDILEQRGVPLGRLYLDARPARLHIVDIALLPEWRGKGLGTAILEALMRPPVQAAAASEFSWRSSIRHCGFTGAWASPTSPIARCIWRWNGPALLSVERGLVGHALRILGQRHQKYFQEA